MTDSDGDGDGDDETVVITVTSLIGEGKKQKLDTGDNHHSIHHPCGHNLRADEVRGWMKRYRDQPGGEDLLSQAILIVIDGYFQRLSPILRELFPRFPDYLGQLVHNPHVRPPYRPGLVDHANDVAFMVNHYGGSGYSRHEDRIKHKHFAIRETWVAGCLTTVPKDEKQPAAGERPVIILIFRKQLYGDPWRDRYGRLLVHQYNFAEERYGTFALFRRLRHQPLFIMLDLDSMFTDWDEQIQRAQRKLDKATQKCFDRARESVGRVGFLEHCLSYVAFLRLKVQVHVTFQKRLRAVTESLVSAEDRTYVQNSRHSHITNAAEERERQKRQRIFWRIDDLEDRLSLADYALELQATQFQGLVDVEAHISNAKTSQRLAWLSVFLFVLAPVSFIASIFGITTMEASVEWFALSGSIVALVSVVGCVALHFYFKSLEWVKLPTSSRDNIAFADMDFRHYCERVKNEAKRRRRGAGRDHERSSRPGHYEDPEIEELRPQPYGRVIVHERR